MVFGLHWAEQRQCSGPGIFGELGRNQRRANRYVELAECKRDLCDDHSYGRRRHPNLDHQFAGIGECYRCAHSNHDLYSDG